MVWNLKDHRRSLPVTENRSPLREAKNWDNSERREKSRTRVIAEGDFLVKAKDCAYRLLSCRPRSVKEINQRLKKKGFASGVIKKTIEYLSEISYLNDEDFATAWVQSRLRLRPVGLAFLRYQLRQKGVTGEIIDKVFSDCAGGYDENEAARKLAISRMSCYKRLNPQKAKKRLYQYLRRRGFPQDAILQAIEKQSSE